MNINQTMDAVVRLAKAGLTLELQERVAELREQVIELREENTKLRSENLELSQNLASVTKGERCPKCRANSWQLDKVKPHSHYMLAEMGKKIRIYICSACGYSEEIFDQL